MSPRYQLPKAALTNVTRLRVFGCGSAHIGVSLCGIHLSVP